VASAIRKISLILGLAGGAASIAVHAYLLAGLLQQADPAPAEIKRLAVGITLGVAGLAAALAVRASQPVSMALLFSLGALGFFPNPTTWAPAGALLIIAGSLTLLDLRRLTVQPAGPAAVRPTDPAVTMADPEGAPLHWSVVARYLRPQQPLQHPASSASARAAGRAPADPPLSSPTAASRQALWSPRSRLLVIVTVVAVAALVVPFSLWPQESVAVASEPPTKAAVKVAAEPSVTEPYSASAADSTTTSTTVAAALTRFGPVDPSDPSGFVLYSDVRFGLSLSVPKDWAEVSASSLADYRPQTYHVAAFAEVKGTNLDDAYLNGLTVAVLAGSQSEDPPQVLVQQSLQAFVDNGPETYDYFKVLQPIHDTTVGGVPALAATARITWDKRVMVKSVYTFIANHCLFRVDLQTDDVDWNDHKDVFDDILASFAFTAAGVTR
jgi:hypothetical protein